jgi:TetR/AcrR family transcriptional regulator, transcriptional repressor of bet genes
MAKKASGTPKKRPGRIRRQAELLTTVYKVVSEAGIDGASMRQIATRAKVSTGTINYHFENKEKLIMAALQAAYQMPMPNQGPTNSPLARLKAFAFGYILHEPNDRFWRFWMNYTVSGSRNPELRRHQNHWFRKQHSFWAKLVGDARRCGELPANLDDAGTAEQLLIFTHGLMVRQILQPEPKSQARCRKLLEDYFEHLEAGKRAAPAEPGRAIQLPRRRYKAA